MKSLAIVLLSLATQAHAASLALGEGTAPYDAHATIQRARIGTYSPRLAPPVSVVIESRSARIGASSHRKPAIQQEFERMDCRLKSSADPIVCTPTRAEEVNLNKKPR
jgi:hypothetical protein